MKRQALLMPSTAKKLRELGANLRLARLRRKLSTEQIALRADISRSTLWMIEKGSPAVAMGAYCQVLFVLGMDDDLLKIAGDDVAGRRLQDLGLEVKHRAPKTKQERE